MMCPPAWHGPTNVRWQTDDKSNTRNKQMTTINNMTGDEVSALTGLRSAISLAHQTAVYGGGFLDTLDEDRKDIATIPGCKNDLETQFANQCLHLFAVAAALELDLAAAIIRRHRFHCERKQAHDRRRRKIAV